LIRPTLPVETPRLRLRAFVEDDLDPLDAYQSRADVARYVPWAARTREQSALSLGMKMAATGIEAEGDVVSLAMELRETGAMIGDIVLIWRSEEHRTGEIGFVLHPDHHGRGLMSEAATEALRIAFEDLGWRRVIGRCDARNDASARLMERIGMRREAHLIENELFKDEWTDEYGYAMLEREWRARREGAAE